MDLSPEGAVFNEPVAATLNRLLTSEEFQSRDASRRLLAFLAEASMSGTANSITEESVGVKVFGRRAGYDRQADPIVSREMRTLRRLLRAYREAHPGEEAHLDLSGDLPFELRDRGESGTRRVRRSRRRGWPLRRHLIAAAIFLSVLCFGAFLWLKDDLAVSSDSRIAILPGSLSAIGVPLNGGSIFFASQESPGAASLVQSVRVGGGTPKPISQESSSHWFPAVSPNGTTIAFLNRRGDRTFELCLQDVKSQSIAVLEKSALAGPMAWSPDSASIYFVKASALGGLPAIHRHSLANRELKLVSMPSEASFGDSDPAVSPHGKSIAFRRRQYRGDEIWIVGAGGEKPRPVVLELNSFRGHTWSADGKFVYGSFDGQGTSGIWRIDSLSGTKELYSRAVPDAAHPVLVAPDKKLLVVEEHRRESLMEWSSGTSGVRSAFHEALPSSMSIRSPNGKQLAWLMPSPAESRLVVASLNGMPARQVPLAGQAALDSLAWSPDGASVVVSLLRNGHNVLESVSYLDGSARAITRAPIDAFFPAFSSNGRTFCYTAVQSGAPDIWCSAWPAGGAVPAKKISGGGAVLAVLSPDGDWVYYVRPNRGGLVRQPVNGGPAEVVLADFPVDLWGSFTVDRQYIYAGCPKFAAGPCSIQMYDVATGQPQRSFSLGSSSLRAGRSLYLNPDAKSISFATVEYRSFQLHALNLD